MAALPMDPRVPEPRLPGARKASAYRDLGVSIGVPLKGSIGVPKGKYRGLGFGGLGSGGLGVKGLGCRA